MNARGLTVGGAALIAPGRARAGDHHAAPGVRLQGGSGGAGAVVRPGDSAPAAPRSRSTTKAPSHPVCAVCIASRRAGAGTRSRSSSRRTRGARFPASTSRATRRRSPSPSPSRPDRSRWRTCARSARRADGSRVTFEFEASPPLPTYLVALAVGAFDMREGLAGTLAMRLAAVSGKAGLGAGALAAARGELVELERYFGRRLPLREAGSGRGAELRRGRDGERRPDHLPRGTLAARRARVAGGARRHGAASSRTKRRTSGSATW